MFTEKTGMDFLNVLYFYLYQKPSVGASKLQQRHHSDGVFIKFTAKKVCNYVTLSNLACFLF